MILTLKSYRLPQPFLLRHILQTLVLTCILTNPIVFIKIEPHTYIPLHTGLAAEIPDGYYAAIYARSGLSVKKGLRPTNCTGIIDNQYRGEWIVALYNDSNFAQVLDHKDRIAQFAILPVLGVNLNEVEELSETERGAGGFGSSGK